MGRSVRPSVCLSCCPGYVAFTALTSSLLSKSITSPQTTLDQHGRTRRRTKKHTADRHRTSPSLALFLGVFFRRTKRKRKLKVSEMRRKGNEAAETENQSRNRKNVKYCSSLEISKPRFAVRRFPCHLKPNSITLSWSQTGLRLIADLSQTC